MRQLLPGKDGSMMNLSLIKLGRRAGKDGIDFALVEALTVKSELNLEDYQLLFPIPTYEIRMNPNLTQNPGY